MVGVDLSWTFGLTLWGLDLLALVVRFGEFFSSCPQLPSVFPGLGHLCGAPHRRDITFHNGGKRPTSVVMGYSWEANPSVFPSLTYSRLFLRSILQTAPLDLFEDTSC